MTHHHLKMTTKMGHHRRKMTTKMGHHRRKMTTKMGHHRTTEQRHQILQRRTVLRHSIPNRDMVYLSPMNIPISVVYLTQALQSQVLPMSPSRQRAEQEGGQNLRRRSVPSRNRNTQNLLTTPRHSPTTWPWTARRSCSRRRGGRATTRRRAAARTRHAPRSSSPRTRHAPITRRKRSSSPRTRRAPARRKRSSSPRTRRAPARQCGSDCLRGARSGGARGTADAPGAPRPPSSATRGEVRGRGALSTATVKRTRRAPVWEEERR